MSWLRPARPLSRPAPLTWKDPSAAVVTSTANGPLPAGADAAAGMLAGTTDVARAPVQALDRIYAAQPVPAQAAAAVHASIPDAARDAELARLLAPVSGAQRLLAYRYDEDERYRARLDRAFELWLSAALQSHAGREGAAELCITRAHGELALAYAPAAAIAPQLAAARWKPFHHAPVPAAPTAAHAELEGAAPETLRHAAIITGEPERAPWDALAAMDPHDGTVRVRVIVRPLPADWVRSQAARLAGAAAQLERHHLARTTGQLTRTIKDPAAAAWQSELLQERSRLLESGGLARCCVVVEAEHRADLDAICSLVLGAMACAAADGTPLPPPRCIGLAPAPKDSLGGARDRASEADRPVPAFAPGTNPSPAPLMAIASRARIARFLEPPTVAAAGLTVQNATLGPAAPHPFATCGHAATHTEPTVELGSFASGVPCRIPIARLSSHAVITGMPGMRKSTYCAAMARRLMTAGVHVAVLEPSKCEYQQLLAGAAPFRVLGRSAGAGVLGINPFAVDEGIRPSVWLELVSSCLVSAMGMEEQPLPLYLEELVRRLYRTRGIDLDRPAVAGTRWPTVQDLLSEVDPYVAEECLAAPDIRANVRAALTLRARALCDQPAFRAPTGLLARDIMSGNLVLRLADLGDESGAFAGMVLLARVLCASRLLGARPLHTVIVVEEAHALLRNPVTGAPTRFARLYEQLLAEARSSGCGLITVEQRPGLLPDGVLANSVTRIAFASAHDEDRRAIGRSLGLTEYQERALGGLEPGTAVVATAGSVGADLVTIAVDAGTGHGSAGTGR